MKNTIIRKIMNKKTLVLAIAICASAIVYALPPYAFEKTYYSNAQKTQVVGGASYMCGNTIYQTGTVTAFYDEENFGSCGAIQPPEGDLWLICARSPKCK